jgi:hypothetical protein
MTIELPKVLEDRINGISDEELEFRPGDMAPDFTLELLSPTGARTGEPLTLSSLRGKPMGLIFGSFT